MHGVAKAQEVIKAMAPLKPLGIAAGLHKILELTYWHNIGHDFVHDHNLNPAEAERLFAQDPAPHYKAILNHCRFLKALAGRDGLEFNLGTVLLADPISWQRDKDQIMADRSFVKPEQDKVPEARRYFQECVAKEKAMLRASLLGVQQAYSLEEETLTFTKRDVEDMLVCERNAAAHSTLENDSTSSDQIREYRSILWLYASRFFKNLEQVDRAWKSSRFGGHVVSGKKGLFTARKGPALQPPRTDYRSQDGKYCDPE